MLFHARTLSFVESGSNAPGASNEPICAELFSPERMEGHAASLAAAQRVVEHAGAGPQLCARSRDNGRVLRECYGILADTAREKRAITAAAEWLLDNFHIVEEQLRQLDRDLTPRYCRNLPALTEGPFAGYPRSYALAWALVAHSDSRFDAAMLRRFIVAYQRVEPLTLRELWSIPLMLGCVLIENLRRLAVQVAASQTGRREAEALADRLVTLGRQSAELVDAALQALPQQELSRAFAVELIQRLRYEDASLRRLNERLVQMTLDPDALVHAEHASQSAANLSVRNIITSMRAMVAFDWQSWFEEVNAVDALLRQSPAFEGMDFATRDRYRHALEELARSSQYSELDIARAVIAKCTAARAASAQPDARECDPGYYLISTGRNDFEREIDFRPSLRQKFLRKHIARAPTAYFGMIALIALAILVVPLLISIDVGVSLAGALVLGVLGLFPAYDIAVVLVNWLVTSVIGPRHLPRLQLAQGVPAALRTVVAVPVLLTSEDSITAQIQQLETHFLSNPGGEVCFALLSDWTDADIAQRVDDERLLEKASAGIEALNAQYGALQSGERRFHLFHRARQWNESEQKWIGWERKRGKLHEFNRLLRGAQDTSFLPAATGPLLAPAAVRYVITVDADTRLPMDTVRRLVGTAAHPLNQPRFDAHTQRVVDGYAVLQPRITPTLPSTRESSMFQRIFSGACGIDPYAGAVSDVYQDLFGEGNFAGKGLYDVDAFEAALAGRVPPNAILSHDLFEGIFARCGLISDVDVFEEFPSHIEVAASRLHRWTRGDWQLLPWIFGRRARGVPGLGRWKMLDNLRRSLSAPAALFTLLASWAIPGASHAWLALVLLALAFPALVSICGGLLPPNQGVSRKRHWRAVADDVLVGSGHAVVAMTLLAHNAWLSLDAIARALYRMNVSRRNLLEWTPAAQLKKIAGLAFGSFLWPLRGASVVVIGATGLLLWLNPAGIGFAVPFLLLWWGSPVVARLISLPPIRPAEAPLREEDARQLRLLGRRIWLFFETYVGAEDNWLPPDNFQETPQPVVAHRSSPTNFGLYLLSVVAARDFGWTGMDETIDRLEATLRTLRKMARHRGHFYNWYDTRDLRPLEPAYISAVDSGNLAGDLLVLAQACTEFAAQPLFRASDLRGMEDAAALLREALREVGDDGRMQTVSVGHLAETLAEIQQSLVEEPAALAQWEARWRDLQALCTTLLDIATTLAEERGDGGFGEVLVWSKALHDCAASHARDLQQLSVQSRGDDARVAVVRRASQSDRLRRIAAGARELFDAMDFSFLLDPDRRLFSIGLRVADAELDPSYYDLLASEARLTSLVAIAKGDVPATHWFHLGRALTPVENGAVLMSWSGSMFEYLMPSLVMYTPRNSLLDQTCRLAVARQIEYGKERGTPWGVSESAYNVRDRDYTYQYSAFGVPGLGLKRGLEDDLVIAPYATALAAMYDPAAAALNLRALDAAGGCGRYGCYESIDYTRTRLSEEGRPVVVRAWFAHHQGMSLVAMANVLHDGVMRHRFHREPLVRAAELLLQERAPREIPAQGMPIESMHSAQLSLPTEPVSRQFASAHLHIPATHVLSNGRYSVMVSSAGSGYSRCNDLAVTRWREDVTTDAWGSYLYLRDVPGGAIWSATYQPCGGEPDAYEASFLEDRARIYRRDGTLATTLEILVSPEDNAEIRHLSIANHGQRERQIEVTSYAEVVLAPQAADVAHAAFSNLFVKTEYLPTERALLAVRRPRRADDPQIWAAHVVAADGAGAVEYETDRARFLGRGRSVRNPLAVMDGRPLTNTVGAVLDPVFSLRLAVRIAPGKTVRMAFSTMMASTREDILGLADKYHDPATFERTSTLAWTHAQVQLHHLGIDAEEAHLFQFLANRILYCDPQMRPPAEVLKRNALGARALWRHGISGDRPIVLLRIEDSEDRAVARQALRAHQYWRSKRVPVDLIILNDRKASYIQDLNDLLDSMVRGSRAHAQEGALGDIFVLRADLVTPEESDLLQTAARLTLNARQGTLAEQVARMRLEHAAQRPRAPVSVLRHHDEAPAAAPRLEFFNGLGGFADEGREYVTVLGPGQRTPAPWINVIANAQLGFLASESGGGYTWSANSRENQLTPWSNDPVGDPTGEALYLRDEDTGQLWGPTAAPVRVESARYVARHGQGYTRYTHVSHGIACDLLQFVSWNDPVKLSHLTLENQSSRKRRLSVTSYLEWVLGASRAANAPFVITAIDEQTGAMFARNPWNAEFGGRVAFVDLCAAQSAWTADRTEFIGRNGNLTEPAGLAPGAQLSGRTGAGLDPCAALQTIVELAPGQSRRVTVLLGQAADAAQARALIQRYRATDPTSVCNEARGEWDAMLGKVQIRTPDRAMDLLFNRWLLYQTLACRMWARAAFYQAGGAYGFRDQLQDSMALAAVNPRLAREQLLRAGARQFAEGDVQHWWHPPTGRGVRTHCSDDLIWLAYAATHYLEVTGDHAVLDEALPFLDGPPIPDGQEDAYFEPANSKQSASLFEHCARALDRSLATGAHGLPLIGSGDWNDGMNRVGHAGRGESVWLAWFLYDTLMRFAPVARARGEALRADRWVRHAEALKDATEAQAWDGAWYRRAYFDDGTPLGTAAAAECRIDSLAQSWSAISGAADSGRALRAMQSVNEYLVRPGDDLILLFTPPFDRTALDPGYIKGYLPGLRENGGQYTHAAVWCAVAWAALGDGDRAGEVLEMLNPLHHASTRTGVHAYKVEPYVMAADIYGEPPHVRRGGWTWYTGAAGWMYRAGTEWLLGIRKSAHGLTIDPCIPRHWRSFEVSYLHGGARYEIRVDNAAGVSRGVARIELDGRVLQAPLVALDDDGQTHRVEVTLGEPGENAA